MVSLCSFGAYPGTLSVDQAGLELTEVCLSLPPELGLKACATTAQQAHVLFIHMPYLSHRGDQR